MGSIFLAASLYLLSNPPFGSLTYDTAWSGVCIFSLFLFWTGVVVPFESLGPELTFDYHERATLFSIRDGAMLAGTLAAASSPVLVGRILGLPPTGKGERLKLFWISVVYAPFLILCCWWCVLSLRERNRLERRSQPHFWHGLKTVAENRPFLLLLISYTVAAFGSNLPATLILFYVEYVLHSKQANFFWPSMFVTGILFLPGWVMLSRRLGKKWRWIAYMGLNTGAVIGLIWFAFALGGAIGPWLGGRLFEVNKNYVLALGVAAIGSTASCAAMWLASPRKVRPVPGRRHKA